MRLVASPLCDELSISRSQQGRKITLWAYARCVVTGIGLGNVTTTRSLLDLDIKRTVGETAPTPRMLPTCFPPLGGVDVCCNQRVVWRM